MKVVFLLLCLFYVALCRDVSYGMFKKNDLLVGHDTLYKERIPYRNVYAKYGRLFKCPITYIRVVDRLGIGHGPNVQLIRGGVRHKYLVLKLTSVYNYPIAVNIYVGCENKLTTTKKTTSTKTTNGTEATTDNTTASDKETKTTSADATTNDNPTTDDGAGSDSDATTISGNTGADADT